MKDYKLTVGLEIHAELATETKMFCNSKNNADELKPNTNICPVCLGYPGTLPTINKEAVRSVLRLGLAVGGDIADYSEFDRKNYFYPDIPKGYQISQYKYPLVQGGSIVGVDITRIHLEEDTAKSQHNDKGDSLLDFNRAGVPLVELVTEPVIHDPETASCFAREFQLLLIYLGISKANMEKGEMRVEANVSVTKSDELGTKVEIKNLNSFRSVERAIKFETQRQIDLLKNGKSVQQETRGWDEEREETFAQRSKEGSQDYRYFPDPDLPKLFIKDIAEFKSDTLRKSLPELPQEKRERYKKEFELKDEDIEIYVKDLELGKYFEEFVKSAQNKDIIQLGSNYIITNPSTRNISVSKLIDTMHMVVEGELSSTSAKLILKELEEKDEDPKKIAEEKGLIQISDKKKLEVVAKKVISNNTKAVDEYKKGKMSSLQFLVGQTMKEMKGSGNPKLLQKIFEDLLS